MCMFEGFIKRSGYSRGRVCDQFPWSPVPSPLSLYLSFLFQSTLKSFRTQTETGKFDPRSHPYTPICRRRFKTLYSSSFGTSLPTSKVTNPLTCPTRQFGHLTFSIKTDSNNLIPSERLLRTNTCACPSLGHKDFL